MGDFSGTITVDAGSEALFDYLSDVANLPRYFSRMTSAAPGDGQEVYTTAKMPDGQEVRGNAWFKVDDDAQLIKWGSEGPSDYHGSLEVTSSADSSKVVVYVHTTRVEDGDQTTQDAVTDTLNTIKRLVEEQGAT